VRHDLPKLAAFNFMLDDLPEGRGNSNLGRDGHGKLLSLLLLKMAVQSEAQLLPSDTKNFPVALLE
jgi:hypothetical protein